MWIWRFGSLLLFFLSPSRSFSVLIWKLFGYIFLTGWKRENFRDELHTVRLFNATLLDIRCILGLFRLNFPFSL